MSARWILSLSVVGLVVVLVGGPAAAQDLVNVAPTGTAPQSSAARSWPELVASGIKLLTCRVGGN